MTTTWQALARLCRYPDDDMRPEMRAMIAGLEEEASSRIREFLEATDHVALEDLQEQYTVAFDFDPACALDIGWHLFGESPERGAFLAALSEDLQSAGLPGSRELPDHLTNILALVSRDDYGRAPLLADLVAPAVVEIEQALTDRKSHYAHVLAGIRLELGSLVKRANAQG